MAGLRVRATIRLDRLNRHGMTVPQLVEGNRSLTYRFASLGSELLKPVNFGGVIEEAYEGDSDSGEVVHLMLWSDLASLHATPGNAFEVWYAEIVGHGHVLDATPVPSQVSRRDFDLTDQERFLLRSGIVEWGGPSRCTEAMAQAMGFESVTDLFDETPRLIEHLKFREPMSDADWAKALGATEVCFTSSLGPRSDWEITTGFRDDETIELIRSLQRKLVDISMTMRRSDLPRT